MADVMHVLDIYEGSEAKVKVETAEASVNTFPKREIWGSRKSLQVLFERTATERIISTTQHTTRQNRCCCHTRMR